MESLKSTVTKLTQQYLSTEHSVLQKAVSDLSNKIDNLQTQESKLSEQIKSTSDALGKHPASSAQLVPIVNQMLLFMEWRKILQKPLEMYGCRKIWRQYHRFLIVLMYALILHILYS